MTARAYTANRFIPAAARASETPMLMLQADGLGASSRRYSDITGVPQHSIADLYENGLTYVTFDSDIEAKAAFDSIVANFPQPEDTTLSLTVVLGLTNGAGKLFEQVDRRVVQNLAA